MNRNRVSRCRVGMLAAWTFCLLAGLSPRAYAGGGPENVLLVVNRNSPASLAIANHYIRLRQIPPGNVLTLRWDPKVATTDVDTFREELLTAIITAITKRRLTAQIDYIVYSSDFPTAVQLAKDVSRVMADARQRAADTSADVREWPRQFTQVGSITGMTYLAQLTLGRQAAYFDPISNKYFRGNSTDLSSQGFRSVYGFGPDGEPVASGGQQYVLSVMLGVTAGRGNSVAEVLDYLSRSAGADGTHPRGTIYYVDNDNVRSRARDGGYPAAVRLLEKLGVAAEIVSGTVPKNKDDVQGAMMGVADFSWKTSGSTILPGAICEHFTSFGGKMASDAGQTPLSELLRYGAAGASGTVTEPYALSEKFPSPMMHVHYARGCTLAEAFYQSVASPYQLLVVGDPLCRPWANIPLVRVEGLPPGPVVQGDLVLTPSATVRGGLAISHFELFVDGWRRAVCRPGEPLPLDTVGLADGYHELRVVAVEAGPIASQGRWIAAITTANHGRTITASATPSGRVRPGTPLIVAADSPGSTNIAVLHNSRLLGQIAGASGQIELDPAALGVGPTSLRVVGLGQKGPIDYAWAEPIELSVEDSP